MKNLYRLINKDKVVGYMELEDGRIWHYVSEDSDYNDVICCGGKESFCGSCDDASYIDCESPPPYIPHTRIDQYTGESLEDGTKLFQRDEIEVTVWDGDNTATIEFKDGAFVAVFDHAECYLSSAMKNIKITGIQGVL